jgi:YHS domain-containing protein
LRGEEVTCPFSGEKFVIQMNKGMRMNHRYGQAVYFCCNGCLTHYGKNPSDAWNFSQELLSQLVDPMIWPEHLENQQEFLGLGYYQAAGTAPQKGDNATARCPVTGENVTRANSLIYLPFHGGQKLHFSTELARTAYMKNPYAFMLSPFELKANDAYGPDMQGEEVTCPYSGEKFVIAMNTGMRMNHRYGQAVYFCCNGCLTHYAKDPSSAWDTPFLQSAKGPALVYA